MPGTYSSLFDIKYTRNGNGDLIARVASNDAFKTSSFKLNLGNMATQDAAAVLESFVKPFVLMPETSVMRQTHRHAHDSLFMPEIEIDFTSINRSAAGVTIWEGSFQRDYNVVSNGGQLVTIGIPTDLLFNKPPRILIDTNKMGSIQGVASWADKIALVIHHELGHVFVIENPSSAKGHAYELMEAYSGNFDGLQDKDILRNPVTREFDILLGRASGFFANEADYMGFKKRAIESTISSVFGTIGTGPEAAKKVLQYLKLYPGKSPNNFDVTVAGSARLFTAVKFDSRDLTDSAGRFVGTEWGYVSPLTGQWVASERREYSFLTDRDGNRVKDSTGADIRIAETVTRDGLAVRSNYAPGTERPISNDIIIPGSPPVDFSQAGGILGQQLGYRLANGNALVGIVSSAALQTLGDNLGDVLDGLLFTSNGQANGAKEVVNKAFEKFDKELLTNLKAAGIGALSSYLTAELVSALGVNACR